MLAIVRHLNVADKPSLMSEAYKVSGHAVQARRFVAINKDYYRTVLTRDAGDAYALYAVLEDLWCGTQNTDTQWALGERSSMVGDLFIIGDSAFMCAPFGWTLIS